jgi:ribose transport system permease protein
MTRSTESTTRGRVGWKVNPVLIAALVAVALVVIGQLVSPGFGAYGQIVSMLRVASFLGIMAIGQTIVVLSGGQGIDLSVGQVGTFAAIIASRMMQGSNALLIPAVIVALVVSAVIGCANGLGVIYMKIPPFVMTLGMMGVVQGLILAYTAGVPAGRSAPFLTALVNGKVFFSIPGVLFVWLAIAIAVTWLLKRTRAGWNLYAVGTNRTAAQFSGIPVKPTIIGAYIASALFAGVGGLLLLGYTESVFLDLSNDYMLPTILAVFVGGTLVSGGMGGYPGTAVGAIVLTVLTSLITTLDMPQSIRTMTNGVVLIILLALYGRQKSLRS